MTSSCEPSRSSGCVLTALSSTTGPSSETRPSTGHPGVFLTLQGLVVDETHGTQPDLGPVQKARGEQVADAPAPTISGPAAAPGVEDRILSWTICTA